MYQLRYSTKVKVYIEIISGVVFLVCGCCIYLFFRSKTLNLYQWCMYMGIAEYVDNIRVLVQSWNIPVFIKYSLPDGLYCAAYILIMDAIWSNERGFVKCLMMALVPFITICSELLQYFELIKGTFDFNDLICYSVPPLVFIINNRLNDLIKR